MLNDKDYKKMAELLRNGSTMLNKACPACNSPLFKFKNEDIFCPVCNKKVIIVKEGEEHSIETNNSNMKNLDYHKDSELSNYSELIKKLEKILLAKLNWLLDKLEKEEQIKTLESYTTILLNFLKLFEKLKEK